MLYASLVALLITSVIAWVIYQFMGLWIAPLFPIFFCIWYGLSDYFTEKWPL